jgi:Recombination endonuclease VII
LPTLDKHPHTMRWTCSHRAYGMDCAELDELYVRAKHRCEICGISERTLGRPLCIDHDASIGQYAVRGLLCGGCNARISFGAWDRKFQRRAERFLANPWHHRPGGPRPLGRAHHGLVTPDGCVHVVFGLFGWSSRGDATNRTWCGEVAIYPRQPYQVDAANLCAQCVALLPEWAVRRAHPEPW